jgi:vanillate/4-hydroxybenzoate decarboxylase subunit C
MYTHGLVTIVSSKVRHAGLARVVGPRVLTKPHEIGYSKVVIVVDDTVDPFNLEQLMWALSTQVNPEFDSISVAACTRSRWIPPATRKASPPGSSSTQAPPVPPDVRGDQGQLITLDPEAAE